MTSRVPHDAGDETEIAHVREIVRQWGWNGTAYQILNPGFSYWIDRAGDAAAGYVDRHGIRVVGGAPVCSDERLPGVLAAFEREAAAADRGVVYFCAESRLAELAAHDARRTTFAIGSQPSWAPSEMIREFTTHSSLRAQLNRARNKGISVRRLSTPGNDMPALQRCLDQWMLERPLPPLHFLVETQTLTALNDRILHVAERAGETVGFTIATPIPARNGWLIEQIVRTRSSPNGTAEILLYHSARTLEAENAAMMTLGLAPLAQRAKPAVDQQPRWLAAFLHGMRLHGRHFYNFEGLEAFKAKFGGAEWAPVYVSLAPRTALPRALLAITAAFSGEPLRQFVPRMLTRGMLREARRVTRL
jgi:phosphatidylglycerol lysyltransferase